MIIMYKWNSYLVENGLLPARRRLWVCLRLVGLLGLLLLSGCGGSAPTEGQTLTIFAAASLTEAFSELATTFEREAGRVDVQLNFAGSQQLAQQLAQGAPADLFASADQQQMEVAIAAGRIAAEAPRQFAGNRMVIVVPSGNPAAIESLADLARPGVKLVLAGETVPAGRYARQVLEQASATPTFSPAFRQETLANVVSHEQNVRAVLTKVALGEADAGMVYASDVAGQAVMVIEIPDAFNIRAGYLIAPVAGSAQPALARAFVNFTLSPQGQEILAGYGLQPVVEQ